MLRFTSVGVLVSVAVVATTAGAVPLRAPLAHSVSAVASVTSPCVPNAPTPAPGVRPTIPLPSPPIQDTTKPGGSAFTLYVHGQADGTHFCYTTTPHGDTSYVEAPTIIVAPLHTFTMTLINQIAPPASPSPVPKPPHPAGDVDGCAWIPYEGDALPQPDPQHPEPGYFNHPRAQHSGMPAWMVANDTNFHTHGWHVSPLVDNVFKSLVYAPKPNTCVFTFTVPKSQPPGTYWYHSHMHGFSNTQVGGGLAGAMIVVPNVPNYRDVLLVVKNAPGPQTGSAAHATAMAGSMGAMAHSSFGDHYASIFRGSPRRAPAPPTAASPVPFDPFNPPPWQPPVPIDEKKTPYCAPLTGGFDALAVNGVLIPAVVKGTKTPAVGPSVQQAPGETVRYRLLNASADSYINLATPSTGGLAPIPLNIIARDGVPVNWNPAGGGSIDPTKPSVIQEPNVFVPPSGRVDITVTMPTHNQTPIRLVSVAGMPTFTGAPPTNTPFCTGYDGTTMPEREILTIYPALDSAARRTANGSAKRGVYAAAPRPVHAPTVAGAFATAQKRLGIPRRAIAFTQYPIGNPPHGPDFFEWYTTQTAALTMRGTPPSPGTTSPVFTERPFFLAPSSSPTPISPYVVQVQVHRDSIEEWDIFNASPEIHAFHIHQLTFVAIQSPFEAKDPYRQVFLDTIALPAATLVKQKPGDNGVQTLTPSVTKIIIDFHGIEPGIFVFHCHMLFHEDRGMMGIVEVLP